MAVRKAAVLADIHSNCQALEACVEDAKRRGAECFIFLGDYVSDLAEPQKCLDQVYEIMAQYPCYLVRGNRDRYMLDCQDGKTEFQPGSKSGSLLYTYQNLRPKDLDFLRGLPLYQVIDLWGVTLEIAHAAKDNDRRLFYADNGDIDAIFGKMGAAYFLTGHSHKQYIRRKDGKTIINPGSAGVPFDHGQRTQYALLEIENGDVRCHLLQIPYDLRRAVQRQFENGLVDCAAYWAISVVYNLITGENWSIALLERVSALAGNDPNGMQNEKIWRQACLELGIPAEQEKLFSMCRDNAAEIG